MTVAAAGPAIKLAQSITFSPSKTSPLILPSATGHRGSEDRRIGSIAAIEQLRAKRRYRDG
jgi:hypothetical protein